MYLLLSTIAFAVIAGLIAYLLRRNYLDTIGPMFLILASVILSIAIIGIPVSRVSEIGNIQKFEAIRATIEKQRSNANNSEIERAAILQTIAEQNAWLAERKFYAGSRWLDIYFPKQILTLKPIE